MGPPVTARLTWFEIFRRGAVHSPAASGDESEGAYVRTHSAGAAVIRFARRTGNDPESFYAVEVAVPKSNRA